MLQLLPADHGGRASSWPSVDAENHPCSYYMGQAMECKAGDVAREEVAVDGSGIG